MSFYTCGPNKALVKSGAFLAHPVIVTGGFVFAVPCAQRVQTLDLSIMTLEIISTTVYTSEGVPISVSSIAQVKISRFPDALKNAATQFLGLSRREVENVALQTLEGHQRAIVSSLTVIEIYSDRKKFAKEVRDVAGLDISNLGLEIVSYTIKDIKDDQGYLDSLGKKRTAEVKRDARIGEAEAQKDAGVREAEAKRVQLAAKYASDTAIADAKRAYELQQAKYDQDVLSKQAEASLAGELQAAKTQQLIKAQTMEINIIERKKQIQIEEEEIKRKEKELEAVVKRPAEAQKYKIQVLAEANKMRVIKESEAAAFATENIGLAEAEVIRAKGEAEASKMTNKAEAWKEYTEGAYMEMIIKKLPIIASELARPLSKTESIVLVSTDQNTNYSQQISSELTGVMSSLPPVVNSLTGVDLNKALKKFVESSGSAAK